MALRRHLNIIHHVPGRLRVRLSMQALPGVQAATVNGFKSAIEAIDGVRKLRISAPTLSAIIEYDRADLQPHLWDQLIEGPDELAQQTFAALIADA